MKIVKKQIYWGIGITITTVTIGILFYRHRKKLKSQTEDILENTQKWLRPVTARISSKFGYRTDPKTGKAGEFHNGIDLAVPLGTQIKSPMAGIVEAVRSGGLGGNEIIITHSNGYKTGYAHLSKIIIKKGGRVEKGDPIGLSGSTGKSTGPHLHFTLTDPSGAKVDPMKMVYA